MVSHCIEKHLLRKLSKLKNERLALIFFSAQRLITILFQELSSVALKIELAHEIHDFPVP